MQKKETKQIFDLIKEKTKFNNSIIEQFFSTNDIEGFDVQLSRCSPEDKQLLLNCGMLYMLKNNHTHFLNYYLENKFDLEPYVRHFRKESSHFSDACLQGNKEIISLILQEYEQNIKLRQIDLINYLKKNNDYNVNDYKITKLDRDYDFISTDVYLGSIIEKLLSKDDFNENNIEFAKMILLHSERMISLHQLDIILKSDNVEILQTFQEFENQLKPYAKASSYKEKATDVSEKISALNSFFIKKIANFNSLNIAKHFLDINIINKNYDNIFKDTSLEDYAYRYLESNLLFDSLNKNLNIDKPITIKTKI